MIPVFNINIVSVVQAIAEAQTPLIFLGRINRTAVTD